jgi:NAD(P)-dependent dehydrogenase (short-subunit alcohol dehydrogenase family)
MKLKGQSVDPATLERSYRSLRVAREIRQSIAAIRSAGSVVEYRSADVRSAPELERVLAHWKRRYGEPVGLIHGAGVIQDKRLRDKTPSAFDRVLGTKVDGALNLARAMNPVRLKFTAFFSSVAGRFGNAGQTDYAAANEILNKLALWLDECWPGRVVSINWGPWSEVGMVSDLEPHLVRRGMSMIDAGDGSAAFLDELRFGTKGQVEVLLSGRLGNLADPEPRRSPSTAEAR